MEEKSQPGKPEAAQPEITLWEYKWGGSDVDLMNRLGRQGWEAVGVSTATKALPLGATLPSSVSVLYKRRLFPGESPYLHLEAQKPIKDNDAGLRLKQLLEEERARKGKGE